MNERSLPWRVVRGFAMFWWDFLVGDTPEIFLAVVGILAVVALVSEAWHVNGLAIVVLPVMVIGALATSVRRATLATRKKG